MVLLVATLLTSTLLGTTGQATPLVLRRIHQMQAQSFAEALVALEAWKLSSPIADSSIPRLLKTPAELNPMVETDSSDFWIRIATSATYRGATAHCEAILGRPRNPSVYEYALRVLDPMDQTSLSQLRITGPLLSTGTQTTPNSLQIISRNMQMVENRWNFWTSIQRGLFNPERFKECEEECLRGSQSLWSGNTLLDKDTVTIQNGNLRIDLSGKYNAPYSWKGTHVFAVQGTVEAEGNFLVDTLVILADGNVTLKGHIRAQRIVLFTQGRITIEGNLSAEVRLLAQGNIELKGDHHFLPWSFAATARPSSRPEAGKGDIILEDDSRFEGYVIGTIPQSDIVIGPDAKLLGAVISQGSLRNEGLVGGVAIIRRLSCAYRTGANCPGGGSFNRDSLPQGLLQPPWLQFGDKLELASVRWTVQ